MKPVCPGLRDDCDCGASGKSLFRIEVVGNNVYSLDGFGGRYISCMVWQREEDAQRAIDARRVVVAVHSVDISGQSPRWSGLHGILILPRRGARNQIHQSLVVTILRKR